MKPEFIHGGLMLFVCSLFYVLLFFNIYLNEIWFLRKCCLDAWNPYKKPPLSLMLCLSSISMAHSQCAHSELLQTYWDPQAGMLANIPLALY